MTTQFLICGLLIGIGATAFMDIVAEIRKAFFNTPRPDYAPVGRWAGYFLRGVFSHNTWFVCSRTSDELTARLEKISSPAIKYNCHPPPECGGPR
jgi:hypothetical protein